MGAELHVDTDELRLNANHLDMYAADLHESHASAHADAASAVPGFGSALSASALTARLARWEQETAEHYAELARHGESCRFAGASYISADADGSERISDVGIVDPVDL